MKKNLPTSTDRYQRRVTRVGDFPGHDALSRKRGCETAPKGGEVAHKGGAIAPEGGEDPSKGATAAGRLVRAGAKHRPS